MTKLERWTLATLLCLVPAVGLAMPRDPDPGQASSSQERRWKWWQDEKSRAELGLTPQQSADIEQIFQSTYPRLRASREELDKLEAELSEVIKGNTAPPPVVYQLVERVESVRAELNKQRTMMLYRMHRELTAEQRTKLKGIVERHAATHRTQPESRRR